MKISLFSMKHNVAANLILHTVVVFLIAITGASMPGRFTPIACIIISAVALTLFTIKNICRCVTEDFVKKAKAFEEVSSSLEAMSTVLRVQEKELERCAAFLFQYSDEMGRLAEEINSASQDAMEKQ